MKGIRVWPNEKGWLDPQAMQQPGAYGRATAPEIKPGSAIGWWEICTPDGHLGCLDPKLHTVTEHDDGTITVAPSIDMSRRHAGAYHGFLRNGEWTPSL